MKKTFTLLTCSAFMFSGCKTISETSETVTETHYSDLWTSAEVASDQSIHSQTPINPDNDPNRILTSKTETGNREFLFADSIKQENGKIMALIEYRYAQTQKLPSNGLAYTHNHWFEEIDCGNKIRTVRTTTHYNAQGEIVDANEYPAPKLTPAQMKLLAQPNDGVIKEVCQRVGAAAPSVSGSPEPKSTNANHAPTVSGSPTPTESDKSSDNTTPPSPKAASESVAAPQQPATQTQPQKNNGNEKIKNTENDTPPTENKTTSEIDFIQKNKLNSSEKPPENAVSETPSQDAVSPKQDGAPPTLPIQNELPDDFWEIGKSHLPDSTQ